MDKWRRCPDVSHVPSLVFPLCTRHPLSLCGSIQGLTCLRASGAPRLRHAPWISGGQSPGPAPQSFYKQGNKWRFCLRSHRGMSGRDNRRAAYRALGNVPVPFRSLGARSCHYPHFTKDEVRYREVKSSGSWPKKGQDQDSHPGSLAPDPLIMPASCTTSLREGTRVQDSPSPAYSSHCTLRPPRYKGSVKGLPELGKSPHFQPPTLHRAGTPPVNS